MALPFLLLALLAADPTAPVATAPATATDGDYMPKGAPTDDFAFVAWCDGVLSGHMDLAAHLSDVLPLDDVQQNVGHAYLRAYGKALASSPESKSPDGKKRAEAARLTGWSNWEAARDTPDKNLAVNTYLAYQLPGRCQHAAERLAGDPNLFRLAPSVDEVAALGTNPVAHQTTRMPAAVPAPAMTAAPAQIPVMTQTAAPMSDTPAADSGAPMTSHADAPAPAPMAAETVKAADVTPPEPAAKPTHKAKPPKVKPTPAPAPTTADGVKKPPRGHLLPWFLRGKKSADDNS